MAPPQKQRKKSLMGSPRKISRRIFLNMGIGAGTVYALGELFRRLRMAEAASRTKKAFSGNRDMLVLHLNSRRHELERARNSKHEHGGLIYLKNNRIVMEWLEDPTDKLYSRVLDSLSSGDTRPADVKGLRWALGRVKSQAYGDISEEHEKMFAESIETIEKHQLRGNVDPKKLSVALERAKRTLETLRDLMYNQEAVNKRISALVRDKSVQILACFHTHPKGSLPEPSKPDLEGSKSIPVVVISFSGEKTRAYFAVKGKYEMVLLYTPGQK